MSLPRIVLVLPPDGLRSVVSPVYSLSFAIHVFVLTLLVVAPSFNTRKKFAADAMVVEMVGSVGATAPAKPPAAAVSAPKPPPQPAPPPKEGVRAASKLPAPADPKKEKTKKKKEEPQAEPATEPPDASANDAVGPEIPAPTPAQGAGKSAPAAAAGGITSLDAADLEFAWYRAQVTSTLRNRWVRPILDDATDAIAATVVFEIRRDGSVDGVRIEASSGVPIMDRSVMRAVFESIPLPPLPAAWPDPVLAARYEFRFRPGEP